MVSCDNMHAALPLPHPLMARGRHGRHGAEDHKVPYIGHPAEDIGVEADVVLANIESALYQNFLLQSTTVIYFEKYLAGQ